MRVSFLGNVCNFHYVLAKFLRRAGIDAHVYYPPADLQQRPESEDPELAEARPDWIHPFPPFQPSALRGFDAAPPELLRELKQSDLLHVHGPELTWAWQTGKPYIWHPYGSDFYYAPVVGWRKPEFPYLRSPVTLRAIGRMRQAIAGADRIIMAWYDHNWVPGYRLLEARALWPKLVRLPIPIDTARFSARPQTTTWPDAALSRTLDGFDLVIFHPTRQMFTPETVAVEGSKGNDIFYRALAQLVHRHGARIAVVIVDRGDYDTGPAKELLRSLDLEANVHWIARMPRHQLIAWYQAADLVVDGLFAGALGLIPIEAMACGTPVMIRMEVESPAEFFLPPSGIFERLPPVINAATEEEIVCTLLGELGRREALRRRGAESRQWVLENIEGSVLAPRYLELYERVLAERR